MKKRITAFLLIFLSWLTISECSEKEPAVLPEYGIIYGMFVEAGETYALCYEGKYTYIYNVNDESSFVCVPG